MTPAGDSKVIMCTVRNLLMESIEFCVALATLFERLVGIGPNEPSSMGGGSAAAGSTIGATSATGAARGLAAAAVAASTCGAGSTLGASTLGAGLAMVK
ncbi:hypothetical protein ACHAWU_005371 [Discostella pseudostelligera]|uniref:Uncharacterized protein n=1 Tax=Discostella pseudostelligera TaxID=259834 RepID=A0ABD3M2Q8_9STRA